MPQQVPARQVRVQEALQVQVREARQVQVHEVQQVQVLGVRRVPEVEQASPAEPAMQKAMWVA